MMNPNNEYQMLQSQQRRNQLLREADAFRQTAEFAALPTSPRYARVLARVGKLMSGIGQQLQTRYST